MRIGIIGTGFMGSTHAAAWKTAGAVISGVTAQPLAEAEGLAKQYGAKIYPSLEAMLPEIDVVDICTPTHLHYEMILQAAEAGKPIVCEKPLCRTVEQAREAVRFCHSRGVKLMVAHVVRFFPEYVQAKKAVMDGMIGKVGVIRLGRKSFQPKKAQDNWYVDFEKSGGIMMDLMIHDFDYARWIAGDVETVFAKSILHSSINAGFDHGLVILTHKSGAISHIEGSWAYPAPMFVTDFEIAGSAGLLTHHSMDTAPISVYLKEKGAKDEGYVAVPASPLSEDPYTTEIKAFYRHLVDQSPLPVKAGDGLAAVQIAVAAIESAKTGKPIHIESLSEVQL